MEKQYEVVALEADAFRSYSKKGIAFDYLSKKQFKELEEPTVVVGNVRINKQVDAEREKVVLMLVSEEGEPCFFAVTDADSSSCTLGYLRVGDGEYLRVEKGRYLLPLLLLFGGLALLSTRGGSHGVFGSNLYLQGEVLHYYIICIIWGMVGVLSTLHVKDRAKFICLFMVIPAIISAIWFWQLSQEPAYVPPDKTIGDGSGWEGDLEVREEEEAGMSYIDIAGYDNLRITADNPTIKLINMGTKLKCYQDYSVVYEGDEVYKTELIKPGEYVDWDAFNSLPGGKYEVTFDIGNYAMQEDGQVGQALNSVTMQVRIEVEKKER